jgi:hypothetical protein
MRKFMTVENPHIIVKKINFKRASDQMMATEPEKVERLRLGVIEDAIMRAQKILEPFTSVGVNFKRRNATYLSGINIHIFLDP